MMMSGTGSGQGVTGFIADAGNSFDPVTEGYPTSNPTTGFSPKNEGFAGIIYGTATDGSNTQLSLYCFDINTNTSPGINYVTRHLECVQRAERQLRGAGPEQLLPADERTGRADRPEPKGRGRAGGDLVLLRPLRAEYLRSTSRRRQRHRGGSHRQGSGVATSTRRR